MRVMIAGGGTGGHVIPALAVAAELRRRGCEDLLLVGTSRGLEARLAPRNGLRLETIDVGALKRVGAWQAGATLLQLPLSFLQAGRILEAFRPHVVYGVGGYASGPVLLMAAMKNIPVVVHEPNAMPGFANRVLAPFVSRALVAFPEASRFFPAGRVEQVGVPVRPEFFTVPQKDHRPPYTILIFGGSQGARRINEAVIESLPLFAACRETMRFIHQTGEKDLPHVRAAFAKHSMAHIFRQAREGDPALVQAAIAEYRLEQWAEVLPFIEDMPAAFARADLLVCRSGASTVAEITAAGKAAILVPFPFAADDHQLKNARSLERAGAARVLLNDEISGQSLFDAVRELLPRLKELEQNSRALAQPRAAEKIVDILERTARYVF